jgi:hypothetical protein
MTVHRFPTPLVSTSTVGSGKVVLMSYIGIGLCGFVVLVHVSSTPREAQVAYSHDTSTTTLNRRLSPASAMNSEVINLGMG